MRLNFRNPVIFSALLAICFAGSPSGAQENQSAKTQASAIQVMMIGADGIPVPAEFQVSLYENLIDQLQKKGVFQHVYRDGDRNALAAPDLIALQCTVQNFQKGSEKVRQVTTVAGATSVTLRCQFSDKGGNSLVERNITGNVRFFGGNLKATYDFAKKAANVAGENFSAVPGRNSHPTGP
ncbi:MAG: hypothetical protein ND895_13580 [Pyrinomonadaceae bacterium]|nr:hypothetical protein [Pyrinomonadaceae bacterium]